MTSSGNANCWGGVGKIPVATACPERWIQKTKQDKTKKRIRTAYEYAHSTLGFCAADTIIQILAVCRPLVLLMPKNNHILVPGTSISIKYTGNICAPFDNFLYISLMKANYRPMLPGAGLRVHAFPGGETLGINENTGSMSLFDTAHTVSRVFGTTLLKTQYFHVFRINTLRICGPARNRVLHC